MKLNKSGFASIECIISLSIISLAMYMISTTLYDVYYKVNLNKEKLEMLRLAKEYIEEAKYKINLLAEKSGVISFINANELGSAALTLGAGRITKESVIDQAVGLVLRKKVGDSVAKGESLLTIHSNTSEISHVKKKVLESITNLLFKISQWEMVLLKYFLNIYKVQNLKKL